MLPFDPRLPLIAAQAKVKTCHVYHCWMALREMGRKFHVEAFAQFAGLEPRHVDRIIAALTDHDALPEKRAKVTNRAMRLPDDFVLPQDWVDWAIDQRGWTPHDTQEEGEIFANYWQAKSGAQAVKLDWKKTWQNWVRNSRRADGDYRPSQSMTAQATREAMERRAKVYEMQGRDDEAEAIRRELASNVVPLRREG